MQAPCDCWTDNIWKAVHTIARISPMKDKEEKKAFCVFILSLNQLISCPIIESEVKFFMKDNIDTDIVKYLPNGDQVLEDNKRIFLWTQLLRSHINTTLNRHKLSKQTPTIETLTKDYDRMLLTKDVWGSTIWNLIHNTTLRTKIVDGFCEKKTCTTLKAFITCIAVLLPCPKCRQHAWEYYKSHPLDPYLDTNLHAFEWTVFFHNAVSQRVNPIKKVYLPLEALKIYATQLPDEIDFNQKFINPYDTKMNINDVNVIVK